MVNILNYRNLLFYKHTLNSTKVVKISDTKRNTNGDKNNDNATTMDNRKIKAAVRFLISVCKELWKEIKR